MSTTRKSLVPVLLGLALLARAATAAETASAVDPVRVVLVLDASGSMGGRLAGDTKMQIARSVVRELAVSWGDRIQLGLVAYGHRHERDCTDIETLVVPAPDSRPRFLAVVDGLQPKGKTPLAAAIEQAAEDLAYRHRRAIVTVVSDGRDTCGLDPCAVASRLEADGADFTAHVIGFDTTEEEGNELRCIASATGGRFARVSSGAELVDALGRLLTRTVEPTGPATLILSAAHGEHEQPVDDGLRWTITALDPASDADAGPAVVEGTPDPIELAPGRYDVRAELGGKSIERQIDLHPGQTWRERVVFGPGQLTLRAVLAEGATLIGAPIEWAIFPVGALGRTAGDPVRRETSATFIVRLEAGRYEVRARYGDVERRMRIELRAGATQPYTVDLAAGEARIFASMPPPGGSFPDPVEWTIRPVDERGSREAPLVERRATNESFILPEGRYHVTGRHGDLIGDAIVRVEAGASEAVGIVLYGDAVPAKRGRR